VCRASHQLGYENICGLSFFFVDTYSGCIIYYAVEIIFLSVMDYHTGWTASLLCECATHAAEQDSLLPSGLDDAQRRVQRGKHRSDPHTSIISDL